MNSAPILFMMTGHFAFASRLYFCLLSNRRYICNLLSFLFFHNNKNRDELIVRFKYLCYYTLYEFFFIVNCTDEGMPFITFVQDSLYPEGSNASKDEGF
jgi:hypothetical protein